MTTIRNDILARPVRVVERIWLSRQEATKYLGKSVDYIDDLSKAGLLGKSKVLGSVFISKKQIDNLMERNMI